MSYNTQLQKTSVLTYGEGLLLDLSRDPLYFFNYEFKKMGIEEKLALPQPKTENRFGINRL